jgi:hypothetical protein
VYTGAEVGGRVLMDAVHRKETGWTLNMGPGISVFAWPVPSTERADNKLKTLKGYDVIKSFKKNLYVFILALF